MENIFKRNIRVIRKRFGPTQVEFAKPLGIKGTSISSMERGISKPSKSVLELIEIKYRVNLSWLLNDEGEMLRPEDDTSIYKDALDPDPEVAKLLVMTREILKSDTDYAASLAANIRSFHKSVEMVGEIQDLRGCVHNHEKRLAVVEKLTPGGSDPSGKKNDPGKRGVM